MQCNRKKQYLRMLSLFLSICLLIGSCLTASAAWDGYKTNGADGLVTLVDMNNLLTIVGAQNVVPSSRIRKTAIYSACWANHTTQKTAMFKKDLPSDFSQFDKIKFQIYSVVPTPETFVVAIYSTNAGCRYHYIDVDWTGWKEFELSILNDLTETNGFDIKNVSDIRFVSSWKSNQHEDTVLYIDSIYATLRGSEDDMSDELPNVKKYTVDQRNSFEEAMSGAIALFNFSANVYQNREVSVMRKDSDEMRTTTAEGVTMVPITFFKEYLGATITETEKGYSISLDGNSISLSKDEITYLLNGETKTFTAAPFMENDILYVSAVEVSIALGKQAKTFDHLTVIGSEKNIEAFESDEELVTVGSYIISELPFDESLVTQEDFIQLKAKARKYLVGDENNDLENEWIRRYIKSVESSGQAAWNSMNRGEDIQVIFGNGNFPTTTAEMTSQYGYVWRMALAYGTYGSALYKNKALKRDIMIALEWLYDHLYGQDIIDGKGWRDIRLFNWWDWMCGVPAYLTDVLIIMEPEMWQADIDKYLAPYNYICTQMRTSKSPAEAASRVYYGTLSAILQMDTKKLLERLEDYEIMLTPVESGVGVQEDWLYITHSNKPYSGTYGVSSLLDRLGVGYNLLSGSKFEVRSPNKYNLAMWMYYMFYPIMYKGGNMIAFGGRSFRPASNEQSQGSQVIAAMLDLIGVYGKDDDIRLKKIIKKHVTEENLTTVLNALNISQLTTLAEVLEDDTIEPEEENFAYVYYTGDRAVQHRNGYAFCISMSSERIATYESINQQNKSGWYTGDGMLYMYLDNDIYQYGNAYRNNVNMYHLPGTTVDTQERQELSLNQDYLPDQDFVGAVCLENQFITAAMAYESYHNDVPPSGGNYDEGGGPLPLHDCTLVAQKSWFMFDDEVVALGAGINADDGFPVHTIVENRRLIKSKKLEATKGDEVVPYKIINVTSAGSDGNVAENVLDGNYETRWSLQGTGDAWIELELEEVSPIGYVGIAVYNGQNSAAIFELRASKDGEEWTTVFKGQSSGTTPDIEPYDMKGIEAKYIRLYGYGRTTGSTWNSYTEIQVYPPSEDGSMKMNLGGAAKTLVGMEDIYVDGTLMPEKDEFEQEFINPKWVSLENNAGYYFPDGGRLTLKKTGGSNKFLEIWFNHGISPTEETYAYVLLPHKNEEETAAYAANPDITILSNTSKIQSVRDTKAGMTGIVFWEAGSFEGITVSEPMIVMLRESNGEYVMSLCDPTHKLKNAKIIIDKSLTLQTTDERLKVSESGSQTVIEVDFEHSKGRSLEAKFTLK